jgi:hypothetical protein
LLQRDNLLWHGDVEEALEGLTNVLMDLDPIRNPTRAENLAAGDQRRKSAERERISGENRGGRT